MSIITYHTKGKSKYQFLQASNPDNQYFHIFFANKSEQKIARNNDFLGQIYFILNQKKIKVGWFLKLDLAINMIWLSEFDTLGTPTSQLVFRALK